jgi:hypothetical protein
MSSELKLRRGSTAAHSTFTGADGEVTLDTDKNVVVSHDGITLGGFPHTKAVDLAASSGASLVGYQSAGTGAIPRTLESKAGESVSVMDFGAIGSNNAGDAACFRKAILHCAITGGGLVTAPFSNYLLTSTVIVPSNVTLDLSNSIITGPGIGSATDLFQSGNLSGGSIITNVGSAKETNVCIKMTIRNAFIQNCGKALNLFNCLWQCEFTNLQFQDCTYAIYSNRSFYSRYKNLMSRGAASAATNAAFYFAGVNNIEAIESVFVTDRVLGIHIEGGANGLKLLTCSAESCTTGILVSSDTGPIQFDTCYLEHNSFGVDLDTLYNKPNISFINCFFNDCLLGIRGQVSSSSTTSINVDETNRFYRCTASVNFGNDSIFTQNKLSFIAPPIASGFPDTPAGFSLGKSNILDIDQLYYDSSTGTPVARTKVFGNALIPFNAEGNGGETLTGFGIPFCMKTTAGSGATVSLIIDTRITYDAFSANLVFNLEASDASNGYSICGFTFGAAAYQVSTSGKTVTVTNNAGYVRLTIANFNTAVNVRGSIRFI